MKNHEKKQKYGLIEQRQKPMSHSNKHDRPVLFMYHGKGSELAIILLKNLFLTLLTVGIYYPWGITEVRRYLWTHTSLDGQRFEYTGTGLELFKGLLKVLSVYLAYFLSFSYLKTAAPGYTILLTVLFGLFVIIMLPLVVFSAHRYKASRTRFRGLHFSVNRSQGIRMVQRFYQDFILTVLSLGIYAPVTYFNIHKNLVKATLYGDEPFVHTGEASRDWFISITNIALTLASFNLFAPWAFVRQLRYRLSQIQFSNARFSTRMNGLETLFVFMGCAILTAVTLGFAAPWVKSILAGYMINRLDMHGSVDYLSIAAKARSSQNATGDAGDDLIGMELALF